MKRNPSPPPPKKKNRRLGFLFAESGHVFKMLEWMDGTVLDGDFKRPNSKTLFPKPTVFISPNIWESTWLKQSVRVE